MYVCTYINFKIISETLFEQTRQIQSLKILVMEKNFILENLNSEIAAMKGIYLNKRNIRTYPVITA